MNAIGEMLFPGIGHVLPGSCLEFESPDRYPQRLLCYHIAARLLANQVVVYWIDVDHQFDIIVLNGIIKDEVPNAAENILDNIKVISADSQYKLDLFLQHIHSKVEQRLNGKDTGDVAIFIDSFSDLYEKTGPYQRQFEDKITKVTHSLKDENVLIVSTRKLSSSGKAFHSNPSFPSEIYKLHCEYVMDGFKIYLSSKSGAHSGSYTITGTKLTFESDNCDMTI